MLLMSGLTQAACTQADLTGTWYAIGVSGNTRAGDLDGVDRCKFKLGSTGRVLASGSSCAFRDADGVTTASIVGGSMSISTSCAVTGSLRACKADSCATLSVQYAQMSRDKNTFAMIGYSPAAPHIVTFYDVVKQ